MARATLVECSEQLASFPFDELKQVKLSRPDHNGVTARHAGTC